MDSSCVRLQIAGRKVPLVEISLKAFLLRSLKCYSRIAEWRFAHSNRSSRSDRLRRRSCCRNPLSTATKAPKLPCEYQDSWTLGRRKYQAGQFRSPDVEHTAAVSRGKNLSNLPQRHPSIWPGHRRTLRYKSRAATPLQIPAEPCSLTNTRFQVKQTSSMLVEEAMGPI
ncbi:hypothetical protein BDY21DRAFT_145097 [Lineolata rhizophorae]|uniref:Uncharacterized protein n=1 Tax=Lineolata rhizophorae TaxID=578093 RepID=A0A6A6NMZ8_9PEZI|nr:hypothetical protein BDY21DRAFT_145097 [Lineolata rhizophorae]